MIENIVAAAAAVVVLALMSVVAARSFPKGARVPMQWGITGAPTWYAPVWFAVSFTPVLASLAFAAAVLLTSVSEKARHDIGHALPMMMGVFLFVHVVHLACAYWHFAARRRADQ